MDDDSTPDIHYAPGVDPRDAAFGGMRVVTANWMPVGTALIMPNEWIDQANEYGYGLRPPMNDTP